MRPPRVRYTVGQLMLAVAIAAGAVAGVTEGILGQNRERCRRWAAHCDQWETRCLREADRFRTCARGEHPDGRPTCPLCVGWTGKPTPGELARVSGRMQANAASFAASARRFKGAIVHPRTCMPLTEPPAPN